MQCDDGGLEFVVRFADLSAQQTESLGGVAAGEPGPSDRRVQRLRLAGEPVEAARLCLVVALLGGADPVAQGQPFGRGLRFESARGFAEPLVESGRRGLAGVPVGRVEDDLVAVAGQERAQCGAAVVDEALRVERDLLLPVGAGQPHGDRLPGLFGDESAVECDGDDGRVRESGHDVRHVVCLAEFRVADLEAGVLERVREVPAADLDADASDVEHVLPVLEVLRRGRGQVDQHADPVLDAQAFRGRVDLLHRHAVPAFQRLPARGFPRLRLRFVRAPHGCFIVAFGVARRRRFGVAGGCLVVTHLARLFLHDGVEHDAQSLAAAYLVADRAPLVDDVLGQLGLQMLPVPGGGAHHDVVVQVVPVGVRGDHELVFAAGDPARELHAELVHPLGRHGVVGAEAELDVVGQPAVLPDAFRRPAVVVEHAFGQRVVVRPGPFVVRADQSSAVGLGGVDDVRHRPVVAAEIRFHGFAELDHRHAHASFRASRLSANRSPSSCSMRSNDARISST